MRIILAFTLSMAGASGLYSFQGPAPASDRGAIHGRVLQSKSGEPVKKAVVILRRGQELGTGALMDGSGAFSFDDLEVFLPLIAPGARARERACSTSHW